MYAASINQMLMIIMSDGYLVLPCIWIGTGMIVCDAENLKRENL